MTIESEFYRILISIDKIQYTQNNIHDTQKGCILIYILIVIFLLLPLLLFLIVKDTSNKDKWGINTEKIYCPVCNIEIDYFRKPKNIRQLLWGGYTCKNCHTEIDKWGNKC